MDPKIGFNGKLEEIRRAAEERAAQRQSEKFNLPYLDLSKSPVDVEALGLLDEEVAKKAQAAVIASKRKTLVLATINPDAPEVANIVKDFEAKGYEVKINICSLSSLRHIFDAYKFVVRPATEITGRVQIETGRLEELTKKLITLPILKEEIINFKSPYTSQIFELVLAGALANRASDIHLEESKEAGRLRLRIDGVLHDVIDNLNPDTYQSLISRIKLLSGLKLNVHDQAQDGRFTIVAGQKDIEIRTSILPSEYGETAVLRVLDPSAIHLKLEDLGMRPDDLKIIDVEINKPHGLILNTGPTGSGKTTTLYAFLNRVYSPEIKIITVEDPIEYHLAGIAQTQVDPESGYTFASGLRSILRQDPDVILVGEIRDAETAGIAIQAALTGHIVFSTLHTNEAAGAIPRLIDLGAKSAILGSALTLIMAQRLVRKLCEHCKVSMEIDEKTKEKINLFVDRLPERVDNKSVLKNFKIFKAAGCEKCGNIGYKGRMAIAELLLVTPDMEEIISKNPTQRDIQEIAKKQGMVKLQEDGLIKVLSGLTSLEEVESVTGPIDW